MDGVITWYLLLVRGDKYPVNLVEVHESLPDTRIDVDDESEFSYVENAENGPANWSNIHPNWIKCKTGKMQSPIDFPNNKVEIVSNLGILQKFYKPSNATLLNRGHDIMLRWDDGGFLKINGTQYRLKQVHWHTPSEHTIDGKRYMGSLTVPPCTENVIWTIDGKLRWDDGGFLKINGTQYRLKQVHWHTPSEHTIDGKRFDMEGHLVHETNDGKNIAVIGILYEIGLFPDLFLTTIEKDLKALRLVDQKPIGINYPNLIKIDEKRYYRYMGSLTVPPCTENVIWTIDGKLRWDGDSGYLKIDETHYQLQQIHWHTPSEHSIDGKRYDMEAHLVHMSSDGKIAVIGILYEIGLLPNDLLTILEGDLVALADKKAEKSMGIIDPNIIKLDDNIYYRYIGSLTTPPCTEGVVWTIDGMVNSVTASQIKLLQDAAVNVNSVTASQIKLLQDAAVNGFESNARPIQPLNGRSIKFNKP
ncbi:hypothetical protein KY284_029328 [Solanum tuberosum]|nr:hypothetical protein KY284_029328 [Solanum tuberosum]